MNSFNLLDTPWISCVDKKGKLLELGLLETLERAHELDRLDSDSPTVNAALMRLLLAILHRCFGPGDNAEWAKLWNATCFDTSRTREYLEEWRDRFDLFDDDHPFYQVAGLGRVSKNYSSGAKPASELVTDRSTYGNARELFQSRGGGADSTLTPACAARYLVTLQQFDTGGLMSRDTNVGDPTSVKAGLLCNIAIVFIQGSNLFETLLLNLVPYTSDRPLPRTTDDKPAWERGGNPKYVRRACRGWLDWLTWQSRRVLLRPNESGNVETFILLGGEDMTDETLQEPLGAYRRDEKRGFVPIGFSRDRALWRNSVALLDIRAQQNVHCPIPVRLLRERTREVGLDRRTTYDLNVLGQLPNKASIVLNRSEALPLPLALLEHAHLLGALDEELRRAEDLGRALRNALFVAIANALAPGERKPDGKDVGQVLEATQAMPRFWQSVAIPFSEFLLGLPADETAAVSEFRFALKREAERCYREGILGLADTSRALKGFALGERTLTKALFTLQLVQEQTAAHAASARI